MIEIRHLTTGAVLHTVDADTMLGVDLSRANLVQSDLSGASLIEANLIGTDLSKANLSGADLTGADLTWTKINATQLPELAMSLGMEVRP
jgi:uncharacterized protein YjbI with pentapeptide repeats